MDLSKVSIKTERLLLVPVSPKYREDIFVNLTKEITKYMFPQPTGNIKDTDDFIRRSVEKTRSGVDLTIVILKLETEEFIGGGGIHKINQEIPELGIWTKKNSHGNKYGREAVTGLRDWAKENLSHSFFKYPVAEANIPSRRIAESLGGKISSPYVLRNQLGEEFDGFIYHIPRS